MSVTHYEHKDGSESFFVSDQTYTKDNLKILRDEYRILFNPSGTVGCMVTPRDNDDALITLLNEDDGFLHKSSIVFDMMFIDGLIQTLQLTKKYCIDIGLYSESYAKRNRIRNNKYEQNEQ